MIKSHLTFAFKVFVAMVIIFAIVQLIASYAGINAQNFLFNPLGALGLKLPGTGNAASTS